MRIWNLEKYSENIAFIDEYDNIVTYADLQMCEKEISQICSRCLVAILCHNNIGAAVGYISFINNGIVPMMLNAHMDSKLLYNLFNTYKPSYVWCPTDEIEQFSYLNNKEVKYQAYKYSLVRMDYDSEYKLNNELALLLTTSGSTGALNLLYKAIKI